MTEACCVYCFTAEWLHLPILTLHDDIYCGFLRWSYCFCNWSYWFYGQSFTGEVTAFMPDNNKNFCTNSTKKRTFSGNEINPVTRIKGN